MSLFQVIRTNAKGTPTFAVYRLGGRRSKGKQYTRVAAEALRSWLVERESGYPRLAQFAPLWPEKPRCPGCEGGTNHNMIGSFVQVDSANCTGPCCRKPPKRVRRV